MPRYGLLADQLGQRDGFEFQVVTVVRRRKRHREIKRTYPTRIWGASRSEITTYARNRGCAFLVRVKEKLNAS